jgi:thiol-disulfide isomerase/thioredoxin
MAKIKLIKFGASFCAACKAMDRSKVFQRFKEKHPEIELKIYDLPGENEAEKLEALGDAEPDEALRPFVEADQEADEYDVQHLPTIIFEDESGNELVREEEALSFLSLERLYLKALEEAKG